MNTPEEQMAGAPQAAPQAAPQGPKGGNPIAARVGAQAEDPNPVVERFIINVMKLASGDQHDKMVAQAKSAKGKPELGLARATYFIMSAVKKGLAKKGVDIPGKAWLAPNGLLVQSTKLVVVLLKNAGIDLTEDQVKTGMRITAESLAQTDHNEGVRADQAGEEANQLKEQARQMQEAHNQGAPPPQAPQQAPQQAPPQGMLPPQGAPQ